MEGACNRESAYLLIVEGSARPIERRFSTGEVKALPERRGRGLGPDEGEAQGMGVVETAKRYYLDPPVQWENTAGQPR